MRHECYYTWTTRDRCRRKCETRKIRQSDYCRACYPVILGLPNPAIDDFWLPLEPFQHLIAATRFIAATGRYGPGIWADYSINFLLQLPMSLAYNTEIVVQMLPCLTSLSELPESLKRYEPQLRFARRTQVGQPNAHRLGSDSPARLRVYVMAPEACCGEKRARPVFSRRWLYPQELSQYGPFVV